jgi:hypothetical protein
LRQQAGVVKLPLSRLPHPAFTRAFIYQQHLK